MTTGQHDDGGGGGGVEPADLSAGAENTQRTLQANVSVEPTSSRWK